MKIYLLEGDMSRRGGTERMTAVLANQLAAQHEIHVVSLHLKDKRVFFPLTADVRLHVLHPAAGKTGMLRQIAEIRALLKQDRPDAVINVDVGMGIYGIFAAAGLKLRVITWEHGNFFNNWNSGLFPTLRRIAARYSDALVVLTERDRENYIHGIRGCAPVTVIPNPVERREAAYDANSRIILSAGNFSEVKRFELIPELGKRIFARHPDWTWVICGEGPGREQVETLAREYGLEKQIVCPGVIADMEEQYRRAAMYVMTSSMEGLPMVLLEAKACGLPLISFDIMTGPSDIIRDGVNGWLVPDNDLEAMSSRILQLMEDDRERTAFAERSALDLEKFEMKGIMDKWTALLKIN